MKRFEGVFDIKKLAQISHEHSLRQVCHHNICKINLVLVISYIIVTMRFKNTNKIQNLYGYNATQIGKCT